MQPPRRSNGLQHSGCNLSHTNKAYATSAKDPRKMRKEQNETVAQRKFGRYNIKLGGEDVVVVKFSGRMVRDSELFW